MTDIEKAINILKTQNCAVVLCKENKVLQKQGRGIGPVLEFIQQGEDLSGFSAADKIVGKAAAMLFSYMGVSAVYGEVMSKHGYEYLVSKKIGVSYGTLTDNIVNRQGNGICPMEQTVMDIDSEPKALQELIKKRDELINKDL